MHWLDRCFKSFEKLQAFESIVFIFDVYVRFIPLFLRETCKILHGREARLFKKYRFKELSFILSSTIGELVIKGHYKAWMLEKAIRSRSFNTFSRLLSETSDGIGAMDLLLIMFVLAMVFVSLGGVVNA